jgi:hypothetical protein
MHVHSTSEPYFWNLSAFLHHRAYPSPTPFCVTVVAGSGGKLMPKNMLPTWLGHPSRLLFAHLAQRFLAHPHAAVPTLRPTCARTHAQNIHHITSFAPWSASKANRAIGSLSVYLTGGDVMALPAHRLDINIVQYHIISPTHKTATTSLR